MTILAGVVVQSSLILLAGLALMPLLRRQSAALRHWVLAAALFCAAAVPIFDRFAPAWVPPVDLSDVAAQVLTPGIPLTAVSAEAEFATTRTGEQPEPSLASAPSRSLVTVLVPVWLAGTLLSCAALLMGLVRLRSLSARARPMSSGAWVDTVARLSRARGFARPLAVKAIDDPALLLVWGVRRPTLMIPTAAESWSDDRITAVVHHELAHIARRDWITQVLSELVRAIYWFNPLVWTACARLRTECEVACDDTVLENGTDGSRYATHIVDIARDLNPRYWVPAPAIVRPSTLERRVRAMLDPSRNRRPVSARARSVAGALIVAFTIAVAGLAAQTFVSMSGTIVDPSSGVLPGVTLVLTNEQSGAKYEIKTDRTGRYEFVGLPPGTYTLEAALPGFARFQGRVTVGGQNLQQDLRMSVGMLQETVTVTDGPPAAPKPVDPELLRRLDVARQKRAAAKCPDVQPGGDTRIGGNIRPPMKFRDVRPIFPDAMQGTSGTVVLMAEIGVDGRVDRVEVVSSPNPAFTESATTAVTQWEFDATLLNCEPVVVPMKVTVNFQAAP